MAQDLPYLDLGMLNVTPSSICGNRYVCMYLELNFQYISQFITEGFLAGTLTYNMPLFITTKKKKKKNQREKKIQIKLEWNSQSDS